MEAKKILFVSTVYMTLTSFLLPFATFFREKGWTVHGMSSGISGSSDCRAYFDACWEIDFSRNIFYIFRFAFSVKKIRDLILQEGYDIVHVHTPIAAFLTRFAMRNVRNKPKLIYTVHGFHFHPQENSIINYVFKCVEKKSSKWSDILITMNDYDFNAAKAFRVLPSENIYLTPGIGINLEYYNPKNVAEHEIQAVRAELGLKATEHIILMVAEFTSNKQQSIAVSSIAELKRLDVHLVLVGVGKQLNRIKKLSQKLKLENQIHFLGYRKDVPVLMRASAVCILPSKREGLPRCLLEAMALGVPVVGSKIRGIEDLLKNHAGILIKPGCALTLSQAIASLLDEPKLRDEIIQNASKKIFQYDLNVVIEIYSSVYERVFA